MGISFYFEQNLCIYMYIGIYICVGGGAWFTCPVIKFRIHATKNTHTHAHKILFKTEEDRLTPCSSEDKGEFVT